MTAQTPAQAMGLKPGSRIATTADRCFGPAGTRGTLIEDDGTHSPCFEMDVRTGYTFSGIRNGYAYYLPLSGIRPLTPEELAEEERAKEPATPDPRDARIAELEKLREFIWSKDIPNPTTPEYREHHEAIQQILSRLDAIMGRE